MGIVHLKGTMLTDYLAGRFDDPSIHRHVERCDLCRVRLRDDRLLCILLGSGGRGADAGHVDDVTLAAYLDEGFDPTRMREIDRHLANCDRCLATCLDLRRMVDAPVAEDVSSHSRARAMDALGSRTIGTLYLAIHGRNVLAYFMAEADYDPSPEPVGVAPPSSRVVTASRYPVPPESRPAISRRSESRAKRFGISMEPVSSYEARAMGGKSGANDRNRVAISVADDLSLEIAATMAMLNVRAVDPVSGAPREGVKLRFEYGGLTVHEGISADDGRVSGKLPPVDVASRLVLPGPPQLAIDIQVS